MFVSVTVFKRTDSAGKTIKHYFNTNSSFSFVTSCFRFCKKFVDNVVVIEGPCHTGIFGQLFFDSNTDSTFGKQTFQLLKCLKLKEKVFEKRLHIFK